jgi:MFS transporter, FHS family, glucose/mannose:H+ symporter
MASAANRRLVWTVYAGLFVVGVYISALGPGLPGIAARAHQPLAQAGTLLSAVFAGGLATSALAGRLMDRLGHRPMLAAGALINGGGCFALAFANSWTLALAAGFCMGVGDTIIVVGTHVLMSDLFPESAGAALNKLNVFFGIGALAGPAFGGAAILALGDVRATLIGVAVCQTLIAASLLRARGIGAAAHDRDPAGWSGIIGKPLLWLLGGLIFVYVGLEIGLGDWSYSYLRSGGFGVGAASAASSGFWLMLALGRALCPLLLRVRSDESVLLLATSAAAVAGVLLPVVAVSRPAGLPFVLLLGLCFGPIWPLAFAVGSTVFARGFGAASGLLAMSGSLGGLGGPWLQGLLLHTGARQGMAYTLAGCAVMALLALLIARRLAAGRRGEQACASTS